MTATTAFELHSTGSALVTVLPKRGDAIMYQRAILGAAPEYLHSRRYGDLYKPAYYHKNTKSVVTSKESIRFSFDQNQPIAVASVVHHANTRALHAALAHVTEDVVVDFVKNHDPWFRGGEMKARYLPGRFWRNTLRREFEVRLEQDEAIPFRGDEILVPMLLNLGRKSRFYSVSELDTEAEPERVQVRPGQALLCRQGSFVSGFRPEGQQVDHLALELTAYWVVARDDTVLDALFLPDPYFRQEAPMHYSPLFHEERGWRWHMLGPLGTNYKGRELKLRAWSNETFAPFMKMREFELRGIAAAVPSLPAIREATGFSEAYWERHYPAYSADERLLYDVRHY